MFRDVAFSVVKLERTIIKHITILVCSSSENLETFFFFSKSRGDPACSSVSVFRCSGVPVFRCSGVPDFKICLARLKESNMANGEGFKEMTAYFVPYMYLRIAH